MPSSSGRYWNLLLGSVVVTLAISVTLGRESADRTWAAEATQAQKKAPPAAKEKQPNVWWKGLPGAAAANPSLEGVFGTGGADHWTLGGEYRVEKDPQVGDVLAVPPDKSLVLTGQTQYVGDRSFYALVRFRPQGPEASVTFTLARRELKIPDPKDPQQTIIKQAHLYLALSANKPAGVVHASLSQDGVVLHDPKNFEKLDWVPDGSAAMTYKLRAVDQFMPGWPENLRAQMEHDMSELPDLAHKWVEVRVEVRKGSVRAWIDDRLLAQKFDSSVDPDGTLRIGMSGGAQLARFRTRSMVDSSPKGFQTIPLGGALNARRLLGVASVQPESLPPAGETVVVDGVPFVFTGSNLEGNDHIDVGRSLLRPANWVGYVQTAVRSLGPLGGHCRTRPGPYPVPRRERSIQRLTLDRDQRW